MFGFGKKEIKTFLVEGMACPRCSAAVKAALEKNKGVKAEIDLEKGMVTVTAKSVSEELVKSVVEACGFAFKSEIK